MSLTVMFSIFMLDMHFHVSSHIQHVQCEGSCDVQACQSSCLMACHVQIVAHGNQVNMVMSKSFVLMSIQKCRQGE